MKLTIKKKKEIEELVQKAVNYYLTKTMVTADDIVYFTTRIVETVEQSDNRSYPELKLYWIIMKWFSDNIPEYVLRLLDVSYLTPNGCHELVKAKFTTESVAFNNMDQDEFHDYFVKSIDWIAQYFFKTSGEKLINEIGGVS